MNCKTELTNEVLNSFLASSIQTKYFGDKNAVILYKVNSGYHLARFEYIFLNYYAHSSVLPFKKLSNEPIGIYDRIEKSFFYKNNMEFDYHLSGINLNEYVSLKNYLAVLKNDYTFAIRKIIRENEHYFLSEPITDKDFVADSDYNKYLVEKAILSIEPWKLYSYDTSEFDSNIELFFDTYENRSEMIHNLAMDFITNNKERVIRTVKLDHFERDYRKQLETDRTFIQRKAIFEAVNDKSIKTVTICYKEGEKELTFKIENRLDSGARHFDSFWIVNNNDRKKFDKHFKNNIQFEHIKSISYRKRALYQAS